MSRNAKGPIGGQASTKESELRERAIVRCLHKMFESSNKIITDKTKPDAERLAAAMVALLGVNAVTSQIINDNLDYAEMRDGIPRPSKEAHADVIDLLERLGKGKDKPTIQ